MSAVIGGMGRYGGKKGVGRMQSHRDADEDICDPKSSEEKKFGYCVGRNDEYSL